MSLHDNDRKVQTRDYLLGVNQVVDAASVALGGVSEKRQGCGLIRSSPVGKIRFFLAKLLKCIVFPVANRMSQQAPNNR